MLRILVALDGSALAERALAHAVALAERQPAQLELLQVFEPSLSKLTPSSGYLEGLAAPLRDQGLSVRCHAVVGLPRQEILAAAHTCRANLLVLATLGRTGLRRVLRGSVAESVVRRAPCPSLIVRPGQEFYPALRTVLIPLDTTQPSEAALDYICSQFAPGSLRLVLVAATGLAANRAYVPARGDARQAVVASLARYLEERAEPLRGRGWTVDCRVLDDRAGPAIAQAARESHTDLVAMASHGRTGLSRLAMGSVTEHVMRHSKRPLLVVRAASWPNLPDRPPESIYPLESLAARMVT